MSAGGADECASAPDDYAECFWWCCTCATGAGGTNEHTPVSDDCTKCFWRCCTPTTDAGGTDDECAPGLHHHAECFWRWCTHAAIAEGTCEGAPTTPDDCAEYFWRCCTPAANNGGTNEHALTPDNCTECLWRWSTSAADTRGTDDRTPHSVGPGHNVRWNARGADAETARDRASPATTQSFRHSAPSRGGVHERAAVVPGDGSPWQVHSGSAKGWKWHIRAGGLR